MRNMIKASTKAFMYVFEENSGLCFFMYSAATLKPPGGKDTIKNMCLRTTPVLFDTQVCSNTPPPPPEAPWAEQGPASQAAWVTSYS